MAGAPAGLEAVQEAVRFRVVVVLALRKPWSLARKMRAAPEACVLAFVGKLRVWMVWG